MSQLPLDNYTRIGRLSQPVARAIRRKAAGIYINENYLRHITRKHDAELTALGFDAMTFVSIVVSNYNRIYKGVDDTLLLVIYNGKPKVTAIELNEVLKKGFYEVKTATTMRKAFLKEDKLLWTKEKGKVVVK
jgi:hypothetical protein